MGCSYCPHPKKKKHLRLFTIKRQRHCNYTVMTNNLTCKHKSHSQISRLFKILTRIKDHVFIFRDPMQVKKKSNHMDRLWRAVCSFYGISMLLKGTLPVAAGTADAPQATLQPLAHHWLASAEDRISTLIFSKEEKTRKCAYQWIIQKREKTKWAPGRCTKTRDIRQRGNWSFIKNKKKRGVSVADACCHGNWGQWMVAMALAAWNSGKGYFDVCLCVNCLTSSPVLYTSWLLLKIPKEYQCFL